MVSERVELAPKDQEEHEWRPVSYTHLDVYKRQGIDSILIYVFIGNQLLYFM